MGNVAEGPYTTLTHGIDATISGRWDYDVTDINPLVAYPGSNTPSAGFHQISLSGVAADARAAAAAGAAFTPTQRSQAFILAKPFSSNRKAEMSVAGRHKNCY